jgi:hypothetical protein
LPDIPRRQVYKEEPILREILVPPLKDQPLRITPMSFQKAADTPKAYAGGRSDSEEWAIVLPV